MAKWGAVILGFLLTIIVSAFFAPYEFVGLLIIGFIVGYIAKSGVLGGLWNAALAGAFGTIVGAILYIIVATVGGSFFGVFAGLTGFTISGFESLIEVIKSIIYYAIVMGITGAVGGALAPKEDD